LESLIFLSKVLLEELKELGINSGRIMSLDVSPTASDSDYSNSQCSSDNRSEKLD
jgi:hypothetical protein